MRKIVIIILLLIISYTGYSLVKATWELHSSDYSGKSFSVASQDGTPRQVTFKTDGTKMYVIGADNDTVYQYSLATAWDVSTASYDSVSFSVAGKETNPTGLSFKPDGTKMYITGASSDQFHQYALSNPWVVSSASFEKSVDAGDAVPQGLTFKYDGKKAYGIGSASDQITEFGLPTAWDIANRSSDAYLDVSNEDLGPTDLYFKYDGTELYVIGVTNDNVYQYSLSTPWDISSATYTAVSKSVAAEDDGPTGLFFRPNGTAMYITGVTNDSVFQYTLDALVNAVLRINQSNLTIEGGNTLTLNEAYVVPAGELATQFDGSTQYLNHQDNTGWTDSGTLTGSFWIKRDRSGQNERIFGIQTSGTVRVGLQWTSDFIQIFGRNSANTTLLNALTTTTITDNNWHHLMFSIDLSDTNKRHVYLDGVSETMTWTTYTSGNMNFAISSSPYYAVAARQSNNDLYFDGAISEFYFNPGTYIDLSVQSNREKFIEGGKPVLLGGNCSLPTGNQPELCLVDGQTQSGSTSAFTATGGPTSVSGPGI